MDEWKNLEIDNLPPDILTGDYEWEFQIDNGNTWIKSEIVSVYILQSVLRDCGYKYRYRKPGPPEETT